MSLPEVADAFADMPRVDAVWRHPRYRAELASLDAAEKTRAYCRHGLPHLLDVARIMWIYLLESGDAPAVPRDLAYACALLHDIGRAAQYATGEPHEEAGAHIAREILGTVESGCAFSPSEQEMLLCAIGSHRGPSSAASPLARALFLADKASRACYACPAAAGCTWPNEKRNLSPRV